MGGGREDSSKPGTPQADQFAQQPMSRTPMEQEPVSQQISNTDGQYEGPFTNKYNYSRTAPPQQRQAPRPTTTQASDDVYGGTAVYSPQGASMHARQQSDSAGQLMSYPDMSQSASRPSMQQGRQGRGVLVKNNRKFTEAYDHEQGPNQHSGRSGPVKKIQDIFRRRRAPTDADYR
jgi:hypothetical protein